MAIAIVGMLDEREEALTVIRDRIGQRGHDTCLIDISVGSGAIVPTLQPDVSWQELAELAEVGAGLTLERGDAPTSIMAEGLKAKIRDLYGPRRPRGNDRHHGDDRRSHLAARYAGTAVRGPQAPHIGCHRPTCARGEVRRLLRAHRHHRDAHRGRHRGHEPPGQGARPQRRRCHLRDGGGGPGLAGGGQTFHRRDGVWLLRQGCVLHTAELGK